MQRLLFRKLRGAMAEVGVTQCAIGRAIGVSEQAVSKRFIGKTPWTLDDMYIVLRLIGKPDEDLHIYFPRPTY